MVQEAAHTGLKETPSESMDQKAMIVCICLWVLNIWKHYNVKSIYVLHL